MECVALQNGASMSHNQAEGRHYTTRIVQKIYPTNIHAQLYHTPVTHQPPVSAELYNGHVHAQDIDSDEKCMRVMVLLELDAATLFCLFIVASHDILSVALLKL